jgi:hypothetical protein
VAPLTVEEFAMAEAAGQRRWRSRTAMWSASDMGDGAVGMGTREARRRHGSDSGEALPVDAFMARRGHVRGAARAHGSHAATAH